MRGIRSEKFPLKHRNGFTANTKPLKQSYLSPLKQSYPEKLLEHLAIPRRRYLNVSSHSNKLVKQAMAMHLDHMYLDCLDTKSSLNREVEVKHLKELVLLHLDLIQQQREDIETKDKVIKDLKSENEILRIHLDSVENKASVIRQKTELATLINNGTNTSPIKNEIKEENPNNNNNETVKSTSDALIHSSTNDSKCPSSVLRPQKNDISTSSKISESISPLPSSRLLRNSSPLLKNSKDDNNLVKSSLGNEIQASFRHSPRLDNSVINYTDSNLTIRLNTNFNDNFKDSYKKISPNKSQNKISSCKEKLNKSESDAPDQNHIKLRSQSPSEFPSKKYSLGASNKRKSDSTFDTEQSEFKRNRKTADNEFVKQNSSLVIDIIDGGVTTHSLRSREKPQEDNSNELSESNEDTSIIDLDKKSISEPLPESISRQENEKLFSKSVSDTTAKLIEQNIRVPGCGIRPVRSSEGILTTDKEYFIPTEPPFDLTEQSEAQSDYTSINTVEIPSWRISSLSSLYVMEGTENLEDEIFTRRHNKHEQDEKRRKRWDLQRMREQRHYEKLKERYEVRNAASNSQPNSLDSDSAICSSANCSIHPISSKTGSKIAGGSGTSSSLGGKGVCGGVVGASRGDISSLWPDPNSALYIEVNDLVPVCAFGQPLAVFPKSEFSLPWLDHGSQENNSNNPLLRRRKK